MDTQYYQKYIWIVYLKPAGEIVLFFLIGQLSTEDKGAGGGGGKGGPELIRVDLGTYLPSPNN